MELEPPSESEAAFDSAGEAPRAPVGGRAAPLMLKSRTEDFWDGLLEPVGANPVKSDFEMPRKDRNGMTSDT